MTYPELKALQNMKNIEFQLVRKRLKNQVEQFEKAVQKFKQDGARNSNS